MKLTAKILIKYSWFVLWVFIALTNSHIAPDDILTKISALDTTIYLDIAKAAPGLPSAGSNLVYHGAQRILFPYLLGLLAKLTGISPWIWFQIAVHICTLLTAAIFWRTLLRLTKNQDLILLLMAILICHPFIFRLQMTFSGFVNDAIFNLGMAIFCYGFLIGSNGIRSAGIFIMIPAKQTIFIILPVMAVAELIFSEKSRFKAMTYWGLLMIGTSVYYYLIDLIISPFSTQNTTKGMALGLWIWLKDANSWKSFIQFFIFLGRAGLGLLPALAILAAIVSSASMRKPSKREYFLGLLFLASIAQPFISGPATTDASVQRLISLGLLPLLIFLMPSLSSIKFRSPFYGWPIIISSILGSTHHLFSRVGPDLTLRYLFLALNVLSALILGATVYRSLDSAPVSNRKN
jgi:hypothetical protein